MGEYARRKTDGEKIKIGTCESMYYCRYEQIGEVVMDKKIKVVMAKIKLGLPITRNEFATVVLFGDDEEVMAVRGSRNVQD